MVLDELWVLNTLWCELKQFPQRYKKRFLFLLRFTQQNITVSAETSSRDSSRLDEKTQQQAVLMSFCVHIYLNVHFLMQHNDVWNCVCAHLLVNNSWKFLTDWILVCKPDLWDLVSDALALFGSTDPSKLRMLQINTQFDHLHPLIRCFCLTWVVFFWHCTAELI